MASLFLRQKARELTLTNRPARLYRSILKELPRVMNIYDILHMGQPELKRSIRNHFYHHASTRDERVIDMLLEKGYIDLEDTLLQHKQKSHLMILLEGPTETDTHRKVLTPDASVDEQFARLQ